MPETDQLVQNGEVMDDGHTQLDPEARQALAAKIEGPLAEVATEGESEKPGKPSAAEGETEKTEETEETEEDGKPAEESAKDEKADGAVEDKTEETEGDKESAEESEESAPSTLPESYRRSATARGWSDAEIDAFYTADSDKAMDRFEKIHVERNAELGEFARLGRLQKQQQAGSDDAADSSKAAQTLPQVIDTEALLSQYGEEHAEVVNGIVGPVNAILGEIHAVLPQLQAGMEAINATQQDALGQQIESFFTGEALEPYAKVYGAQTDGLTAEQQGNRAKTLEYADALIAGSQFQGREMSTEDALVAAHQVVSAEFTAEKVRREIAGETRKRAAAVGLKPGKRGKTGTRTGKPTNAAEQLAKVTEGLKGAFGPD